MGAAGEGNPAAAVRVLVVDDSPVDRKVVELLLRNHKGGAAPFHVTAVDSGRKAMELIGPKGQGKLGSSDTDANVSTEMHDPSPCTRPITHHRSNLQMQSYGDGWIE